MFKMVDGTGIIGVDMICPLGVSTPQPPNYDRVELEGTGMLALPNSLNAPLERLELGGKTEQVQTTGKNLFDPNNNYEDLVWIRNDGEIVGGSSARTSDYIPVEQGNYAFQFDIPNPNQMFVAGYNADRAFVKIVGTISKGKGTVNIDDINIKTIRLSYTRDSTKIQLEFSANPTPYEPYTGGKPSPSPEYPQEIKNSGKRNEETQKYEVDVKITNAEQNWSKEQVLTLTSDRPITKWDRLVEQGGEIGWLYKSTFINGFNGDGYTIRNVGNIGSVGRYTIIFPDALIKGNASADIYVDKYRGVAVGYAKEEYGICCNWNDGAKYFNAPNENVKTLDDFKKWLTENPLTIAYETEKTTFIPLPQSEQNAIRALKTYYPTTVITADGGELDPDIKLTYRKEI